MQTDDQTLESGAGEAAEPTEPAQPEPHGDPLDDIQDEKARAEAKRDRAIARRQAKKEPEPTPSPALSQDVAKKDDLAVIVTNQAKQLVSPEVREVWDELIKIPLGGANPMDAHSIAENMADRLVIYKTKQTTKDNPTKDLTSSPGIRGATGTAPSVVFKDRFNSKKDADSWIS